MRRIRPRCVPKISQFFAARLTRHNGALGLSQGLGADDIRHLSVPGLSQGLAASLGPPLGLGASLVVSQGLEASHPRSDYLVDFPCSLSRPFSVSGGRGGGWSPGGKGEPGNSLTIQKKNGLSAEHAHGASDVPRTLRGTRSLSVIARTQGGSENLAGNGSTRRRFMWTAGLQNELLLPAQQHSWQCQQGPLSATNAVARGTGALPRVDTWHTRAATFSDSTEEAWRLEVAQDRADRPKLKAKGVPVVHHELYSAPTLPAGHRFPMKVFDEVRGTLVEDGVVSEHQVLSPSALPQRDDVLLAHAEEYLQQFESGTLAPLAMRRIGFPWSDVLVQRTLSEVSGTLFTAELALAYGLACNTAGGTHHAHRDFGSGFCILNDIAITALALLERGTVDRIAIVDLDVHQGDGTAAILQNEPRAFTFSMHCGANFPARKQESDLDVDVLQGSGDSVFLAMLSDHLPHILRTFLPSLVLYDAGVDPHKDDALGKLNLTDEGLYRRELQVLDTCLGFGVPVACLNGGGYDDDLKVLARRHCLMHRAAREMWESHQL